MGSIQRGLMGGCSCPGASSSWSSNIWSLQTQEPCWIWPGQSFRTVLLKSGGFHGEWFIALTNSLPPRHSKESCIDGQGNRICIAEGWSMENDSDKAWIQRCTLVCFDAGYLVLYSVPDLWCRARGIININKAESHTNCWLSSDWY